VRLNNKLEQTKKLNYIDLYEYRFNNEKEFFLPIEVGSIIIIAFWAS